MAQELEWPVQAKKSWAGQFRVLLAGVLVLGGLAYLVMASLPQGTVYYQTVKELKAKPASAQPVRVAGIVASGSVQRASAPSRLSFDILDGSDRLPVTYSGVVPDIFGPGVQVVVEGQRDANGVFQAQTLLAKCPSRFAAVVPTPGGASQP